MLKRTGNEVKWTEGRDKWWHEETARVPNYCPPEIMASEDPLFILYVSPNLYPFSTLLMTFYRHPVPQASPKVSSTLPVVTSSARLSQSSTSSTSTPTIGSLAWPISVGLQATREPLQFS